jgi:hypothetical protein
MINSCGGSSASTINLTTIASADTCVCSIHEEGLDAFLIPILYRDSVQGLACGRAPSLPARRQEPGKDTGRAPAHTSMTSPCLKPYSSACDPLVTLPIMNPNPCDSLPSVTASMQKPGHANFSPCCDQALESDTTP